MNDATVPAGPPSRAVTDPAEILRARARALAQVPQSSARGASLDVVEFKMASERYAVEQRFVREVFPLKELTPLPCTPAFIRGMINVRGQILVVIDMKRFFDLPDAGITDLHVVIILHVGDVEVGLLADAVASAYTIPLDEIQPSLPTLTGIRERYLRGVSNQHVVIIDAEKVLTDPKLIVDEKVDTQGNTAD